MDLFNIFAIWLTIFSISFTLLPILQVLDWKRRGTADGFSSVNFVLPILMMSCWCKHGFLTNDFLNVIINSINLFFFTGYILAFAYYQPKRQYLIGQLFTLFVAIYFIFAHVNSHQKHEQPDKMGAIAAASQIISLFGGIYDIKRAISLKTMEYIPASLQFGIFALCVQWTIFGILTNNIYMAIANIAALFINIITLVLYFIYPPKTWRVPIFGVGKTDKKIK